MSLQGSPSAQNSPFVKVLHCGAAALGLCRAHAGPGFTHTFDLHPSPLVPANGTAIYPPSWWGQDSGYHLDAPIPHPSSQHPAPSGDACSRGSEAPRLLPLPLALGLRQPSKAGPQHSPPDPSGPSQSLLPSAARWPLE